MLRYCSLANPTGKANKDEEEEAKDDKRHRGKLQNDRCG
jgi:hypothetical protein